MEGDFGGTTGTLGGRKILRGKGLVRREVSPSGLASFFAVWDVRHLYSNG